MTIDFCLERKFLKNKAHVSSTYWPKGSVAKAFCGHVNREKIDF